MPHIELEFEYLFSFCNSKIFDQISVDLNNRSFLLTHFLKLSYGILKFQIFKF